MSLLDKASLIVTPNGYSEDTLYSVVPSSGAGDLSFTRATDAWRTNSEGLVQRTPWNIFRYSEDFSNSNWSKGSSTISTNTSIAPNGTLTANSFVSAGSGSCFFSQFFTIVSRTCTISIYIKYVDRQFIQLVYASAFSINYANFDIKNGLVTAGVNSSSSISNIGNGWFRISMTTTGGTNAPESYIWAIDSGTSARASTSSGVGSYYIWGAQAVEGSSALEYFPTTDRRNVPRIDYSLGGCPTLLMEPQRTNRCLQSEQISTTPWSNNGGTTTLNAIASPSGIVNADKFNEDASTGQHYIGQQITALASTTYTMSIYAKKAERDIIYIRCFNSTYGVTYCSVNFNLTTGVATGAGAAIQSVGNGWYRCSISFTTNTDPVIQLRLNMTTDNNYPGVVGNGMYIWGTQLEAGDSITSYIPTTTASVTRNADSAIKAGISSLLGQTEGTVFYEISIPKITGLGNQVFSNISNDAASFFCNAFVNSAGNIVFDIYAASGIYTFTLTTSAPAVVGRNRVALVYKAGAYKVFLNGVLVATSTNSTPITNTISRLALSSGKSTIYHYEFVAFKSALSDSELELLTGDYFDSYAKMAAFYNYTLQ